jgi:Ser/Thr protein kinase RdoA (MazF antagonist)
MPDPRPTFEDLTRVRCEVTDGLRAEITGRYDFGARGSAVQLDGGEECAIWRIRDVVVRIAPAWRSLDELGWVHSLVAHVARSVPEASAPIVALDGTTAFLHDGHPVTLHPFVDGRHMRRTPSEVAATGSLLARVHAAIADWDAPGPRPPSRGSSPRTRPRVELPEHLRDEALDAWHAGLDRRHRSVIHGDVYRRNILVRDGAVVGLLDWDEAHEDVLPQEIAWTMWECANVDGIRMDGSLARSFLDGYTDAGGRLTDSFASDAPSHIRWRLREEVLDQLTARRYGEPVDEDYAAAETTAFHNLR